MAIWTYNKAIFWINNKEADQNVHMRFHSLLYGIMHVFTSEIIHQIEGGPDRYVSNNIFSSATHSEPAMKARECEFH